MHERRLLLAGSTGPERLPARRDPGEPRWFEPLHVRDPGAARRRIADQVAAGADVVLAPTWRTHRRALLPVGETRRARAWTAAAATIAREGVELGLELRRESRASEAWGAPLVAAVLPALDDEPDQAEGRIPTHEVATEADIHDQAGILADGVPDLILVEDQSAPVATILAVASAAQTGLPTWVALDVRSVPADGELERIASACREDGADVLLVPMAMQAAPPDALVAALSGDGRRWGGHVRASPTAPLEETLERTATTWLSEGAGLIAVLEGARPEILAPVRRAIERVEEQEGARRVSARARWLDLVARAARMALGGRAAWVGSRAPDALPGGFAWTVVPVDDVPRLPEAAFRLVVHQGDGSPGGAAPAGLARILDEGGILVTAVDGDVSPDPHLRLVDLDRAVEPWLAVCRRA